MTEVPGGPGTPSAPASPGLPGGPCREDKSEMWGSFNQASAINELSHSSEQNCEIHTRKNIWDTLVKYWPFHPGHRWSQEVQKTQVGQWDPDNVKKRLL